MKNRDRYPIEWTDVIRPDILKRDNYKCTKCNVVHRSSGYYASKNSFVTCDEFMLDWCKRNNIKVVKLFLQIAHLDNDPSNNDYSNLKAMCPRCHIINDMAFSKLKRMCVPRISTDLKSL